MEVSTAQGGGWNVEDEDLELPPDLVSGNWCLVKESLPDEIVEVLRNWSLAAAAADNLSEWESCLLERCGTI